MQKITTFLWFDNQAEEAANLCEPGRGGHYWARLTEGGEEGPCGWLKDKFGLSWQIVPRKLTELLADPDPVKADRVMKAMFEMKKIDIQALDDAYEKAA
jgi:predicted 3-demethylubiquinone-9 3-methyltransferase (glyoxalase superfamily)